MLAVMIYSSTVIIPEWNPGWKWEKFMHFIVEEL